MVTQRSAKPFTPVQFRVAPPNFSCSPVNRAPENRISFCCFEDFWEEEEIAKYWRKFFKNYRKYEVISDERPGGGIGRHEGLKIPCPKPACGFKSRPGHHPQNKLCLFRFLYNKKLHSQCYSSSPQKSTWYFGLIRFLWPLKQRSTPPLLPPSTSREVSDTHLVCVVIRDYSSRSDRLGDLEFRRFFGDRF